ncbi:unnamed protein product [Schistosoma bovis]|nr:unnamed protein product [Schistosoma bovis]
MKNKICNSEKAIIYCTLMLGKIGYDASWLSSIPWKAIHYALLFLMIEIVTFAYGVMVFILLYQTYIPTVKLERELDLVFDTKCNVRTGCPNVCSFPTANFSVSESGISLLTPKYPYMLMLNLWLPDSIHNRNAGMSIITLELYGREHVLIQRFRKPFSMPYRSNEVRMINNILFAPLYIIGRMKEELLLSIEMSSSFQFDATQPVLEGRIIMESKRYLWSALELKIQTTLSGFQNVLYYYPQVSFIICISVVSFLMNMIYISSILLYILWRFLKKCRNPELSKVKDEPKPENYPLCGEIDSEDNSFSD